MTSIAKVLKRARVLLGDQEDQEWTDEEMLMELDAFLLEANSEVGFYKRWEALPISEGKRVYELPDDVIELKRLKIDGQDGPELPKYNESDAEALSIVTGNNTYFPFGRPRQQVSGPIAIQDDSANTISLMTPFDGDMVSSVSTVSGSWEE